MKFSHYYEKMPDTLRLHIGKTMVIQIFVEDIKKLSTFFLAYDTKIKGEEKYYKLPRTGKVIVIILWTEGHLWTTIRPCWPSSKEAYYRKLIGKEVEIIMANKEFHKKDVKKKKKGGKKK